MWVRKGCFYTHCQCRVALNHVVSSIFKGHNPNLSFFKSNEDVLSVLQSDNEA